MYISYSRREKIYFQNIFYLYLKLIKWLYIWANQTIIGIDNIFVEHLPDANDLLASSLPPSGLIRLRSATNHVVYLMYISKHCNSGCSPTKLFHMLLSVIGCSHPFLDGWQQNYCSCMQLTIWLYMHNYINTYICPSI